MPDTGQKDLLPGTEPTALEGVVERIVFESEESGFFVARLRVENNPELVTFVGNIMAVSPGETIRINGHWNDDRKPGHGAASLAARQSAKPRPRLSDYSDSLLARTTHEAPTAEPFLDAPGPH